jgi:hypothetical protein
MVLDDFILERMTAAQWQAASRPKVTGTRDLDLDFPDKDSLDFFVMLSSFVGVAGHASQANTVLEAHSRTPLAGSEHHAVFLPQHWISVQ